MEHWTLDDIPWDAFDRSRLDPELVKVVKAACMVEHRSGEYAEYLCGVFKGDNQFCQDALTWAQEEVQHGKALRRYAELADPDFDFDRSFSRFLAGHVIDTGANQSIRGSRCSELIARCIVEVGTSAYYSALGDASDEPVLRAICKNIAADEFRHYKLFYTNMKRYQRVEHVHLWSRLKTAIGRIAEAGDDELSYAYYCASDSTEPYDRARFSNAYAGRVFPHYRYKHVQRALGMSMKAIGIKPQGHVGKVVTALGWRAFRGYVRRVERIAA